MSSKGCNDGGSASSMKRAAPTGQGSVIQLSSDEDESPPTTYATAINLCSDSEDSSLHPSPSKGSPQASKRVKSSVKPSVKLTIKTEQAEV